MTSRMIVVAVLSWSAVGGLWACESVSDAVLPAGQVIAVPMVGVADAGGDATRVPSLADATSDWGAPEAASSTDAAGEEPSATVVDGGVESAAAVGDAGTPSRLLLSYNGASQSELVAFDLASHAVAGRLIYPGYIGTTYVAPEAPWLLEQSSDVVVRLDGAQPWVPAASWGVAMHDGPDSGGSYSDPVAILVGTGTKAYVLRYARNEIAILDTSSPADGGSPIGSLDLSSQLQAGGDGTVEMTAAVYVPSKQLVYVLLANINRGDVACGGYCLLCAPTHPTVVAIDVTTDSLVDINGAAPGVGLALSGEDPAFGQGAMAYDAESDRLLILHAGCNEPADGGGAGPLVGREIEELSLFTGETRMLLDLTSAAYPSQLVYIDPHRAIVQLDTAYTWDPTTPLLGPAIPNAPDSFAWDGVANLIGVTARYGDAGFAGYDVLSVRVADGKVTRLGADPFSLTGGFLSGVQLWPAP